MKGWPSVSLIGASDQVIGIAFSEEMIDKARQAVEVLGALIVRWNFVVRRQKKPIGDSSIKVILVNGIFNEKCQNQSPETCSRGRCCHKRIMMDLKKVHRTA